MIKTRSPGFRDSSSDASADADIEPKTKWIYKDEWKDDLPHTYNNKTGVRLVETAAVLSCGVDLWTEMGHATHHHEHDKFSAGRKFVTHSLAGAQWGATALRTAATAAHVALNPSDSCVKIGTENTREFIRFVEKLVGKRVDMDRLAEIVDDMIEMNRIWYEVNELRKAVPCPMHSRHFWSCMPASLYLLGDVKDNVKCYQNLYDELSALIAEGQCAVPTEKYRLGFSELPPWHSLKFFDKLAERGWNFVVESWAYHPPIPMDLSHVSDPVEKIARHSLQFNTGYYQFAKDAGSEFGYMGYPYVHWAKEFKIDGMFMHPLVTCRSTSTHLGYTRETLERDKHVPSLWIEGDIVDFTLFDPEEALRKAEAFEEIMEHYREKRQQAGFDW